MILFFWLISFAKIATCTFNEKRSFTHQVLNEFYNRLLARPLAPVSVTGDDAHSKSKEYDRFIKLQTLVSSYHFRSVSNQAANGLSWSGDIIAFVTMSRMSTGPVLSRTLLWHAKSEALFKCQFERIMGRSDARWKMLHIVLERFCYQEMEKRLKVILNIREDVLQKATILPELVTMQSIIRRTNDSSLYALYLGKAISICGLFSFRKFSVNKDLKVKDSEDIDYSELRLLNCLLKPCELEDDSVQKILIKKLDKIILLRKDRELASKSQGPRMWIAIYFQLLCWAMQEQPDRYDIQAAFELEDRATEGQSVNLDSIIHDD